MDRYFVFYQKMCKSNKKKKKICYRTLQSIEENKNRFGKKTYFVKLFPGTHECGEMEKNIAGLRHSKLSLFAFRDKFPPITKKHFNKTVKTPKRYWLTGYWLCTGKILSPWLLRLSYTAHLCSFSPFGSPTALYTKLMRRSICLRFLALFLTDVWWLMTD